MILEKRFVALSAVFAIALLLFGCAAKGQSSQLKIGGSDTMVILGQAWAEKYMQENPGKKVSVTGGGSGVGITALTESKIDIAEASRDMKPAEIDAARKKGVEPVKTIVAYDGIAIIVHPENPIEKLTIAEIRDIFTGKITNWKELGGSDEKIDAYSRESSSGTYEFMKEHVLANKDYASAVKYSSGSAVLVESVSQSKTAIGYTGVAYARQRKDVKIIPVAKDEAAIAYLPDKEHVKSGAYSIARSLNFYTNEAPAGDAKAFVDFVLGSEGQSIAESTGYFGVG
ncbi:MAG: PstS family phosphate ABC transporter substrate-binding protein [Candidatus Anstonellaceae archaeon]